VALCKRCEESSLKAQSTRKMIVLDSLVKPFVQIDVLNRVCGTLDLQTPRISIDSENPKARILHVSEKR
jgi:hypothetical protein